MHVHLIDVYEMYFFPNKTILSAKLVTYSKLFQRELWATKYKISLIKFNFHSDHSHQKRLISIRSLYSSSSIKSPILFYDLSF